MIETARLRLRRWEPCDRAPFAAMNQDAEVMRHLGGPLPRRDSDMSVARMAEHEAAHGYGFWAVERASDGVFLGFCGVKTASHGLPGEPEIGWRLRRDAWGEGYALEAAQATIRWAGEHLPAARLFAMTVEGNTRSWGLMRRLGMARRADLDFDHPAFPPGHPLRRHVIYLLQRG